MGNYFYILIYLLLSIAYSTMEGIRVYLVNKFNQTSQNSIFERMTRNLFKAPINEFFERVPIGRILNRYSEDMTIADN